MATEINEEVVVTRVKEKNYFSEAEFPAVPKLLGAAVGKDKLTVTEAFEFAAKQAELFNKDEVFLVVLAAVKHTGKRGFYEKNYEGGKPYAILAAVTPRMLPLVMDSNIEGDRHSTFVEYMKVCGLNW